MSFPRDGLVAARNFSSSRCCDLGLPDGSGLDLMKELRQSHPDLKGIAVSGYGRYEDMRDSKEAGFSEHLTKPVDFDALVAAVERVV